MHHLVFIIHTEPDACDRCKQIAYVNGKDASEGFNVHVATPDTYKEHGMVHKNCRCVAELVSDIEGLEADEFVDENTVLPEGDVHLSPAQLGGSVPENFGKTTIPYNPGKNMGRVIDHHHRTRRNVGESFFTVVSKPVVNLVNSILSLFGGSSR